MTTYGLRIHDKTGAITMDTTSGVTRLLGIGLTTSNAAGAYSNPQFQTAKPFYVRYATSGPPSDTYALPVVNFDGLQTINWSAAVSTSYIIYGTYAASGATNPAASSTGYGLRVHNPNGDIQIDNAQPNLFFIGKQSISINVNTFITITINGKYPVVAYRGTGMIAVFTLVSAGVNTWTATICGDASANTVGTLYVFDSVDTGALDGTNYGLRVYDASGAPIFDSRAAIANIYGDLELDGNDPVSGDPDPGPFTMTLPRDNLAVIVSAGYVLVED